MLVTEGETFSIAFKHSESFNTGVSVNYNLEWAWPRKGLAVYLSVLEVVAFNEASKQPKKDSNFNNQGIMSFNLLLVFILRPLPFFLPILCKTMAREQGIKKGVGASP